jgi:hypothetical protein
MMASGSTTVRRKGLAALAVGLAAAGGTLALYLGVAHGAVSQTMHGFVHENDSIGLTFDDGSLVGNQAAVPPTIPPGTYSIRVLDDASEHNFHLVGPGVDQSTDIGTSASPTWSVTLQPGAIYKFVCDNHPDFMYGTFQTSGSSSASSGGGTSGSSSSSGGSSSSSSGGSKSSGGSTSSSTGGSAALSGTLAGTLSATGVATLKLRGKTVSALDAGRYRLTVVDKASSRSFVLQKKGGKAMTVSAPTFVGKHTVTVTLTAGQWSFYTLPGGKSKHSFTVS